MGSKRAAAGIFHDALESDGCWAGGGDANALEPALGGSVAGTPRSLDKVDVAEFPDWPVDGLQVG